MYFLITCFFNCFRTSPASQPQSAASRDASPTPALDDASSPLSLRSPVASPPYPNYTETSSWQYQQCNVGSEEYRDDVDSQYRRPNVRGRRDNISRSLQRNNNVVWCGDEGSQLSPNAGSSPGQHIIDTGPGKGYRMTSSRGPGIYAPVRTSEIGSFSKDLTPPPEEGYRYYQNGG